MARGLRAVGRKFSDRQAAISFLRENPGIVQAYIGNIAKNTPKLLTDAGYLLGRKRGKGGGPTGYRLYGPGGKVIADWDSLPDPINPSRLRDANDRGSQKNKGMASKGKPRNGKGGGKGKNTPAGPDLVSVAGVAAGDVPSGIDYEALGAQMGIDPRLLRGLGPNVGNRIPLGLTRQGARPMGQGAIDDLVQSMIGDQYLRQEQLVAADRARMEAQNRHNLEQIEHWYDQVLRSQGVAAERDREFGRAAVESAQDATTAIIGALGGEANEGSYVVGAAGQENVGLVNALGTIQDQYNADLAPLLEGEKAGQLTREQAMGGERLRDLSRRLLELQSERGSKEAELRFNVWQANNEILDRRLQTQLAIRQANQALAQQRFQNRMGIRQMQIAAATAGQEGLLGLARVAQEEAEARGRSRDKAADRAFRAALEQAKEAGRNYRATLGTGNRPKPYASAGSDTRDDAYYDIVDTVSDRDLTPQQAMRIAAAIVGGYG